MIERLKLGLQEVRELGLRATLFRLGWEVQTRSGLARWLDAVGARQGARDLSLAPVELVDATLVAEALGERLGRARLDELRQTAEQALAGRVLCFGRWVGDFGDPIDWHRDPRTGERWRADLHWAEAVRAGARGSDIKLTWEVGRFPHGYHLARAAAFDPELRARFAAGLAAQMEHFVASNPRPLGVHWASGQEIAFRLLAWLFAWATLGRPEPMQRLVAQSLHDGAVHVERHIGYARHAVYNNHLLSEALLLYAAGLLLPAAPEAARWRESGRATLEEQAERQFYSDGGYIQNSHNYHRLALQDLLWAHLLANAAGERPAPSWLAALSRSVDFLVAHQCPQSGRLPNYGANDGGLPAVLSTCDYSDFRPTLQAASLASRGVRLYEPGPWDEEAAWWLGPAALDRPLRPAVRRTFSFAHSGYHVLRGRDAATFCTIRCGSILDRFSQIDMLHLDLWWRGHNLLVDGGSYLYNGPKRWHDHFLGGASHNTVTIDGRDQMLHWRRFKTLYWTQAKTLDLSDHRWCATFAGEHYGYRRQPGSCVHRRAVLVVKDGFWVVADTIFGTGRHSWRLHWLAGDFPAEHDCGRLTLLSRDGPFGLAVFDAAGRPLQGDLARGEDHPPRGWLSRYYGEKIPVPSYAVGGVSSLPLTTVTVLGAPADFTVAVDADAWSVQWEATVIGFRLEQGLLVDPTSTDESAHAR